MTYFAVDDDDLAVMKGMKACYQDGLGGLIPKEHFRGFEPEIYSPVSGTQFQSFGITSPVDPLDNCAYLAFDEEIMHFSVYFDSNDVEGLLFEGQNGSLYPFRANGQQRSPRTRLDGRPIGFRVWQGLGAIENQVLLIAIVYNTCNCPASTWILDSPPADLEIVSGATQSVSQTIQYQENYIAFTYGQDCGKYKVTITPDLPFLRVYKTGLSVDADGSPYFDRMTLTGAGQVGVYDVQMIIEQDASDSTHGFNTPFRGTIPSASYSFQVRVLPCQLTSLDFLTTTSDLLYSILDPPSTSTQYATAQTPDCGYPVVLTITGLPAFATHDEANQQFEVQTSDDADVGVYTVEVTATVQVPTDPDSTIFSEMTQVFSFTITVESNICATTSLSFTQLIPDLSYSVASPSLTSSSYETKQVSDCGLPVAVTFFNLPTWVTHDDLARTVTIPQTSDTSLIGSYSITAQGEITFWTDQTQTTQDTIRSYFSFTIFVEPCVLNSYFDSIMMGTISQGLGAAALTQGTYGFTQDPACGYLETITVTNLPSFASHDEVARDFTVQTSNLADVGTYSVQIAAVISVPDDYSQATFTEWTASQVFEIEIVVQQCQPNSHDFLATIFDISYSVQDAAFTSASYETEQVPDCGITPTVSLTGLPAWASHDGATRTVTVPQLTDLGLIGSHPVTVTSEVEFFSDATQTTTSTLTATFTFTIFVEPCVINSYFDSVTMGTITQVVGAAALTQGTYEFTQDLACSYPETITVTNVPAFASHDDLAREFTVSQVNDLGLIGVYTVSIKAEISVPTDYTQTVFTPYVVEYPFDIRVEPCDVTTFDLSPVPADMIYTVGDPSLTDGAYDFFQDPACGYDETLSVTGLGAYVNHDAGSQDFTVPQVFTNDAAGSYAVTIRGEISLPVDAEQSAFTTIVAEHILTVYIEPCQVTQFTASTVVPDVFYPVGDPTAIFGPYAFTQDLPCGYDQTFSLIGLPGFVTHDEIAREFTLTQTADLSLIGAYPVTIRAEIQVPTDAIQTAFDTVFAEQTFTIFVEPCVVNTFSQSTQMGLIQLYVGSPGFTQGTYAFEQDSACGYPETVTVSNLPPFIEHYDNVAVFNILQVNDIALIGVYSATIRAEISVPTDYTKTVYDTIFAEQILFIRVEPCVVATFDLSLVPEDMFYTVGDPSLTGGAYNFIQNPACGYEQTVIVTGLEQFIVHNSATQDFSVLQTDDLSKKGGYMISIEARIEVPDDSSLTSYTTITKEASFLVIIRDPCEASLLDDFDLSDMTVAVKATPITQTLVFPADEASRNLGEQDGFTFCGPRVFEISTIPSFIYSNFLSFDPSTNTLTLGSQQDFDLGIYGIQMRVYLERYPQNGFIKPFVVEITWCQVTDLMPFPVSPLSYGVFQPALLFAVSEFTQVPDCGYSLEYDLKLKDPATDTYSPLPAFISEQGLPLVYSIQSIDTSIIGDYQISILGKVPFFFMTNPYMEELLVDLRVFNSCEEDQVINVNDLPVELIYYIAEDGVVSLEPFWLQTKPECPSEFGVKMIAGGLERDFTTNEALVLRHKASTGWLEIETSNYSLDSLEWTIKLFKRSSFALNLNRDGAHTIRIVFRDICWDSLLQPAQWNLPIADYSLQEMQSNGFTKMMDLSQGLACGGYTHELIYVSGPKLDLSLAPENADLSPFTLVDQTATTMAMTGAVQDFSWLGTHQFRLKSTLGSIDFSPSARGASGLYNSAASGELTIVIRDPCMESIVNSDSAFKPTDISVPLGQASLSQIYAGPSDSVSLMHGNGYDICGSLEYELINDKGEIHRNENLSVNISPNEGSADSIEFTLVSERQGQAIQDSFTLIVRLSNYPSASPATFPVQLTYRECFPVDFNGPLIEDLSITVGQIGPLIDIAFDQAPCSWPQTYSVEVQSPGDEQFLSTLPSFVTQEEQTILAVGVPLEFDVGDYAFRVCSSLKNSITTEQCAEFSLRVEPVPPKKVVLPPSDFDTEIQVMPVWSLSLSNQKVKIGESLLYQPEFTLKTPGFAHELIVDLGMASAFASYNQASNSVIIHGSLLSRTQIGTYLIKVRARVFDSAIEEKTEGVFFVEVWDRLEPPPTWLPDDFIEYRDWTGTIREDLDPSAPEKGQPIPYIADVSRSGLVTIGWNRNMAPPLNYSALPDALVAVRNWGASQSRRQLSAEKSHESGDLVWFADLETRVFERLKLLDALEIQIRPEDEEFGVIVSFEWDILGYDNEFIWLQLDIKNPWDVSADGQFDTIFVTFWGTEYFKSLNNKEVRYGTTISHKIFRQTDGEEVKLIEGYDVRRSLVVLCLIVVLPFVSTGSLLPTWMFINALSLLAHLPLLNANMPANAHLFLKQYLDMVRWYDEDNRRSFSYANRDQTGALHELLNTCGYEGYFLDNLGPVFAALMFLSLCWLLLTVKSRTSKGSKWRGREGWCFNFSLRFFYVFFFEFCIALCLNLYALDISLSSLLTIAIAVLTTALLLFLVSLFFCRGPYVEGYYQKWTALHTWGLRPLNPDYDSKTTLQQGHSQTQKQEELFLNQSHSLQSSQPNQVPTLEEEEKSQEEEASLWKQIGTERELLQSPVPRGPSRTPFQSHQMGSQLLSKPRSSAQKYLPGSSQEWVQSSQTHILNRMTTQTVLSSEIGTLSEDLRINDERDNSTHLLAQQIKESSLPIGEQQTRNIDVKESGTLPTEKEVHSRQAIRHLSSVIDRQERYEGGQPDQAVQLDSLQPMLQEQQLAFSAPIPSKLDRQTLIENQQASQKLLALRAKREIEMADAMTEPARYKTLYYGLKLNHSRNVAVVHPCMFLVRRVLFACILVFGEGVPLLGVFFFMGSALVMLGYTLAERQWKDRIINNQHAFNESTLYILSVVMLLFSSFVSPAQRQQLGQVMIAMVLIFLACNLLVMLLNSLRLISLVLKKQFFKAKRKVVKKQARAVQQRIKHDLDQNLCFKKDWFVPDQIFTKDELVSDPDQIIELKIVARTSKFGGITASIKPVDSEDEDQACRIIPRSPIKACKHNKVHVGVVDQGLDEGADEQSLAQSTCSRNKRKLGADQSEIGIDVSNNPERLLQSQQVVPKIEIHEASDSASSPQSDKFEVNNHDRAFVDNMMTQKIPLSRPGQSLNPAEKSEQSKNIFSPDTISIYGSPHKISSLSQLKAINDASSSGRPSLERPIAEFLPVELLRMQAERVKAFEWRNILLSGQAPRQLETVKEQMTSETQMMGVEERLKDYQKPIELSNDDPLANGHDEEVQIGAGLLPPTNDSAGPSEQEKREPSSAPNLELTSQSPLEQNSRQQNDRPQELTSKETSSQQRGSQEEHESGDKASATSQLVPRPRSSPEPAGDGVSVFSGRKGFEDSCKESFVTRKGDVKSRDSNQQVARNAGMESPMISGARILEQKSQTSEIRLSIDQPQMLGVKHPVKKSSSLEIEEHTAAASQVQPSSTSNVRQQFRRALTESLNGQLAMPLPPKLSMTKAQTQLPAAPIKLQNRITPKPLSTASQAKAGLKESYQVACENATLTPLRPAQLDSEEKKSPPQGLANEEPMMLEEHPLVKAKSQGVGDDKPAQKISPPAVDQSEGTSEVTEMNAFSYSSAQGITSLVTHALKKQTGTQNSKNVTSERQQERPNNQGKMQSRNQLKSEVAADLPRQKTETLADRAREFQQRQSIEELQISSIDANTRLDPTSRLSILKASHLVNQAQQNRLIGHLSNRFEESSEYRQFAAGMTDQSQDSCSTIPGAFQPTKPVGGHPKAQSNDPEDTVLSAYSVIAKTLRNNSKAPVVAGTKLTGQLSKRRASLKKQVQQNSSHLAPISRKRDSSDRCSSNDGSQHSGLFKQTSSASRTKYSRSKVPQTMLTPFGEHKLQEPSPYGVCETPFAVISSERKRKGQNRLQSQRSNSLSLALEQVKFSSSALKGRSASRPSLMNQVGKLESSKKSQHSFLMGPRMSAVLEEEPSDPRIFQMASSQFNVGLIAESKDRKSLKKEQRDSVVSVTNVPHAGFFALNDENNSLDRSGQPLERADRNLSNSRFTLDQTVSSQAHTTRPTKHLHEKSNKRIRIDQRQTVVDSSQLSLVKTPLEQTGNKWIANNFSLERASLAYNLPQGPALNNHLSHTDKRRRKPKPALSSSTIEGMGPQTRETAALEPNTELYIRHTRDRTEILRKEDSSLQLQIAHQGVKAQRRNGRHPTQSIEPSPIDELESLMRQNSLRNQSTLNANRSHAPDYSTNQDLDRDQVHGKAMKFEHYGVPLCATNSHSVLSSDQKQPKMPIFSAQLSPSRQDRLQQAYPTRGNSISKGALSVHSLESNESTKLRQQNLGHLRQAIAMNVLEQIPQALNRREKSISHPHQATLNHNLKRQFSLEPPIADRDQSQLAFGAAQSIMISQDGSKLQEKVQRYNRQTRRDIGSDMGAGRFD